MLKRIITSIVAVCVLLPILIFSGSFVFPLAIAIVSCISLYEMYKCIGKSKKLSLCIPSYIFAAISPFALRYVGDNVMVASLSFIYASLFVIYLFFMTVRSKGDMKFGEAGEFFMVSAYIIASFLAIIYIRDFDDSGKYLYLLIFIGAWITDIFAYFTGVFFGKHKLIPEVSPKKTIEGSIGGTVFCTAFFVLFGIIVDTLFNMNANLILLAVSGIIVSVVSQIGDLIMSVIKRQYGVKDYGKIFPGPGGMLDRFDSILAVALVLSVICIFARVFDIALI